MHAFMALFFYELVRDQIVFIWHAWAIAVGPTDDHCSCVQDHAFFDDGDGKEKEKKKKDKSAPIDQAMSKTVFLIICVYIFIYLIIYWRVLRPERRSRHWSLLQVLRRVATPQNSDWAKRQRLVSFNFVLFFFFFFLPVILNTKCSKTETWCTCASCGNWCRSLPRRVFFFLCWNAVYATPIGTSGLHPKESFKKPLWSERGGDCP